MSDLVIRGGTLVAPDGLRRADLAIEDERISAIAPELRGAAEEIDATGLFVFPGIIDVHLHFNEPGRTDWEGASTGSRALAAAGGALFFDMPLNSTPCTVNARAFDLKASALAESSIADYGLWGGLVPGNVAEMAELAARGVVGFKAFLCDSGLPEFPRADDRTLWEGLCEAARLGLPVAVHAENHDLVRPTNNSAGSAREFLASRPVIAETEAIQRAAYLAAEAGARLHIVHVSSGRGVAVAAEARVRGVDISIETCPHYLFFDEEDLERLGVVAKCAPPFRSREEQDRLWDELRRGVIDIVASDHSPAPPEKKAGNFFQAWGGIAGVQSTLAVLLDSRRDLPLERIGSLLADMPARRFRIHGRGRLAPGYAADLALVDCGASFTLKAEDLHQRHRLSPYVGHCFRGAVRRTIRRGETIFREGVITAQSRGRLVRPAAA
ncbi:MAG: allantoinase AllB [Terriglobia bacterium]|nr:MAG: allantoinase AllB [Terriglobia bacterium]